MTTLKNQAIVIHADIADVNISITNDIELETLQAAVKGNIEPIEQYTFPSITLYVNKDRLQRNLSQNMVATILFGCPLVGNVVMVATDDELARDKFGIPKTFCIECHRWVLGETL